MTFGLNKLPIYPPLYKYLRSYPQWRFAPPRVQVDCPLERIGTAYGGYALDSSSVGPECIVYSLGIGEDISFDLALIHRFGVNIHAFDPTPRVKIWLSSQAIPEQFHFHDIGIAHFDGQAVFYLPRQSDFVSHSVIPARQYAQDSIQVPVIRLITAMRRLGHARIDILKIDIEGEEYAVIEDLVKERIPVQQILIEFHHRLSSIGTGKTRRVLSLLHEYGMRICYICSRMEIFTLLRVK